jgi:DNA primase
MSWINTFIEYAHEQLTGREREALWSRGVSDDQIRLYQIGYVSNGLPCGLEGADVLREKYQNTGWLRDVFVLPLTNTLGQNKGFQLRHVEEEKKGYSHFSVYEEEPVLFGLGQAMRAAWETRCLWLTEGVFDLFPIQRVCPNVIPTLTNHLSAETARCLRRVVDELWLAYDMDLAGRKAAARVIRDYSGQFSRIHDVVFPRVPKFRGGKVKDPNELWLAWGDNKVQNFIRNQLGECYA